MDNSSALQEALNTERTKPLSDAYCTSRTRSVRRRSREVRCGSLTLGGKAPVRVQSMTTSLTTDVKGTIEQCIRLAEVGCEIVRVTAPNKQAAQALKDIRKGFSEAGFANIPLVADIHFLPVAAMEAIEHVEKVRVNPGNYADKKKFAVMEYSDSAYEEELERLHEAFSPLVLRAKELGRCLRIGTNHGSLSDRIMNRYGDSPLGMVESALEFIRIAQSHGFHDMVLSMKASNPKVMIQAYRLAVERMLAEDMHYPLHLGVTEAGDGEDARIKSAIGIGSLLYDGLGDTVRVSLTEDPWYEIPVCQDLVRRAEAVWKLSESLPHAERLNEDIHPFEYRRREVIDLNLGPACKVGPLEPPRVIVPTVYTLSQGTNAADDLRKAKARFKDAPVEGLLVKVSAETQLIHLEAFSQAVQPYVSCLVLDASPNISSLALENAPRGTLPLVLIRSYRTPAQVPAEEQDARAAEVCAHFNADLSFTARNHLTLAADVSPEMLEVLAPLAKHQDASHLMFTFSGASTLTHPSGSYRKIVQILRNHHLQSPLWIRVVQQHSLLSTQGFGQALIEASFFAGTHFIDGYGDFISIETVEGFQPALTLAYNILQGARMRVSKTEYVACPSCGRTLFNLQEVTQRIKAVTGHLKGVTIAVMGCIVNGPGEMADADFGYVGGAPGKVNLYIGKNCVKFNIPEAEALNNLIALIKENGKWVDPS